jgi:hypothetical protein
MIDDTDIPCVTNPEHSLHIHKFHPPPLDQPALPLYIPPCVRSPSHALHLPSSEQPLRIHIEGPLLALQKLLPEVSWHLTDYSPKFAPTWSGKAFVPPGAHSALSQSPFSTLVQPHHFVRTFGISR